MKSIINKTNVEQLTKQLEHFFKDAETIAMQTKFVQRKSRLSGSVFLKAIVFGFLENPSASLMNLAQHCSTLGIEISPQGIHERINTYAVDFMKTMFSYALKEFQNKIPLPLDILKQFSAVYLLDSTFKQLPESMSEEYPGAGGKGSSASLKVQLVFEFLRGNVEQVTIEAGRKADQAYRKYQEILQTRSIIIFDLGYFSLISLKTIADLGAFFITRYLFTTSLMFPDGEKINLLALLQKQGQETLDLQVIVGASTRKQTDCRLIAVPVPENVIEERRRKAKRRGKTRGKPYTKEYMSLLGWNVYLSNVPQTMLSASQVILFYRIRWQIELVFKFWKSYCGVGHIVGSRQERVMTEFYAKLLIAVMVNFFVAPVRIPEENWTGLEMSTVKVRNILSSFSQGMMLAISSPPILAPILQTFLKNIGRFGLKQKRTKNPNICALLVNETVPYA